MISHHASLLSGLVQMLCAQLLPSAPCVLCHTPTITEWVLPSDAMDPVPVLTRLGCLPFGYHVSPSGIGVPDLSWLFLLTLYPLSQ